LVGPAADVTDDNDDDVTGTAVGAGRDDDDDESRSTGTNALPLATNIYTSLTYQSMN